jgi:hypothetical protein
MTAEVAVLNKLGVAMAADSASTVGSKVSNAANKIFAFCRNESVGVMTYGLAEFMGAPWETLIKLCREQLGQSCRDSIGEYADALLEFLRNQEDVSSKDAEVAHVKTLIGRFLSAISRTARQNLFNKPVGEDLSLTAMRQHAQESLNEAIKQWRGWFEDGWTATNISAESGSRIALQNQDFVREISNKLFREDFPFGVDHSSFQDSLMELSGIRLAKINPNSPDSLLSGVVIVGFGRKQVFPAIRELQLEGFVDGQLKFCSERSSEVTLSRKSLICPFAQARDALETSLSGVAGDYKNFVLQYVGAIYRQIPEAVAKQAGEAVPELTSEQLSQVRHRLASVYGIAQLTEFAKELNEVEQEQYRDPVLQVVAMLSVPELAALAEALVNLAALRKKLSPQTETVGGPTDVAVITKCDGFIWVKRKHFFEASMNPQFMARYLSREYPSRSATSEVAEGSRDGGQDQASTD